MKRNLAEWLAGGTLGSRNGGSPRTINRYHFPPVSAAEPVMMAKLPERHSGLSHGLVLRPVHGLAFVAALFVILPYVAHSAEPTNPARSGAAAPSNPAPPQSFPVHHRRWP